MCWTLWASGSSIYVVTACWERQLFTIHLKTTAQQVQDVHAKWELHFICLQFDRDAKQKIEMIMQTIKCPVSSVSSMWPFVEVENNSPEGSVIQEIRTDGPKIPICHNHFMMPTKLKSRDPCRPCSVCVVEICQLQVPLHLTCIKSYTKLFSVVIYLRFPSTIFLVCVLRFSNVGCMLETQKLPADWKCVRTQPKADS